MGEELWYVKLANGDVHRVTIDQLDGAFQAGHIDESTMVLAAGASEWSKLGEIAGLDEEEEPPPEPAADEIAYVPQTRAAPYVAPAYAAPAPHAAAPAAAEAITYIPQTRAAPYVAPAYAATIPVATRAVAAPVAYAAPAQRSPYSVAIPAAVATPNGANSLRPMSMDLGDLDLDMPPRKSRAGRFVGAVLAIAVIAGGGAIASNRLHLGIGIGGGRSDLSNVAAAAAVAAPPADVAPPPAVPLPAAASPSPSPAAAIAAAADGSPMNPQFTSRFNEDTTKKLLSADKSRDVKAKSRHSGGGGASPGSHTKSTTFTTGGNKFDPLNSAI